METENKNGIIDTISNGEIPTVPIKVGLDAWTIVSIAGILLIIVAIILMFIKMRRK